MNTKNRTDWLKKLRQGANLTQAEAAERSGISKSYYEKIENGMRSASVNAAKKISAAFGFEWTAFFESEESK